MIPKRPHKDIQQVNIVDIKDNVELKRCFDHFNMRHNERCGVDLSYSDYLTAWVCYLRGYYVGEPINNRMIRVIGDYFSDDDFLKIIYTKIGNFYAPLTLYKVTEHKKKYYLYIQILKYKNAR